MSPLEIAQKYLGQHEIAGVKDNQFILDCFKHTGYKAAHDEVPWCAAFICRVLDEAGIKSTHSAAADSYRTWGKDVPLMPGAIVTFRWSDGQHHVSICHHVLDANYVVCLGGNQSDMVKLSVFPRNAITGVRGPI